MSKYNKIRVVCPSNMITGGPEALHQLVNHMCSLGLPACIVYFPFDVPASVPKPYRKYNTPVENFEDNDGELLLFPEIYPMIALKVKHASSALWWLSLDNFLERKNISHIRDKYHYLRAVFRGKKPARGARALISIINFSQTEHATQYLMSCGIKPVPLIDSINERFLNDDYKKYITTKENVVLYNPTKGKAITKKLRATFPEVKFLPLSGYSPEEISKVLYSAKLYIDFGHHPGRDRLPREAAMHGCCIISGLLGSASNAIDLPIPAEYKLDSEEINFTNRFGNLAHEIFNNFDHHYQQFESFRAHLKNEPTIFKQQIADYFLNNSYES